VEFAGVPHNRHQRIERSLSLTHLDIDGGVFLRDRCDATRFLAALAPEVVFWMDIGILQGELVAVNGSLRRTDRHCGQVSGAGDARSSSIP
jgi:hypothetical protein